MRSREDAGRAPAAPVPAADRAAGEAARLSAAYGNRAFAALMAGTPTLARADDAVAPGAGPAAATSAGPAPVFDHSGGKTVTIHADTAMDFAANVTSAIGAPHVSPEFTPDIQFETKPTPKGGEVRKITSIGLTVKTSITKVRYGLGRANKKHQQAIETMVAAIAAHELEHRKIIETAATAALKAAQKHVGTGAVETAHAALSTGLAKTTNAKHTALDAKEGKLTAVEKPDGSVEVKKGPSGAKY